METKHKKIHNCCNRGTKKYNSVCLVGGRSGGHIVPCLTLAQRYKEQHPDKQILFFCSTKPIDLTVMREQGTHIDTVVPLPLQPLSSRSPFAFIRTIWSYVRSFVTSFWHLYTTAPEKVITTGSDVAIPVVLAAYILRIPVKLYEVNAIPGKAVTFLARFSTEIAICFAQTARYFPRHTCSQEQYPLRFTINADTQKISSACKTILILGGSQGSQFINKLIQQLFLTHPELKERITVAHQYGNDASTVWDDWYAERGITATTCSYTNDLAAWYQQADLVICRAGAGSLFETVAYTKPMICIPLETHQTDHQLDNARACAQEYPELCHVIRQHELHTPEKLYELMQVLLTPSANLPVQPQGMDTQSPLAE